MVMVPYHNEACGQCGVSAEVHFLERGHAFVMDPKNHELARKVNNAPGTIRQFLESFTQQFQQEFPDLDRAITYTDFGKMYGLFGEAAREFLPPYYKKDEWRP